MGVVPAAPLRSISLSFMVWHEKASHPQNMFSKAKRLSGSRVCHLWMYVQRPGADERDEERNDRSGALGATVRLSSQPHCGSSQVPAVENDVQQDCYSTESHDPDDQQLPHGPQIQPSPGCEVPAEQFWNNLGHLFHDTIDGTLYQSLPCRPASKQEDSIPTEQTLAPLDRRKSAEVLDQTISHHRVV